MLRTLSLPGQQDSFVGSQMRAWIKMLSRPYLLCVWTCHSDAASDMSQSLNLTLCPQPHEAGWSHGTFDWQYCLQDWCGYCQAWSHGESQTEKERCVGQAVRWSDGGKKPPFSWLVTACMACFLLALRSPRWLGRAEGAAVKTRWLLRQ